MRTIAGWSAASFLAALFTAAALPTVMVLVAPNANADGPFWDLVFWAFRKALWFASPHGVLIICAALAIVAYWRGWMKMSR